MSTALTPQQIQQLQQWADAGMDLNAIQKQLREEFALNLTYMQTRFLVMDHGIVFPEKKPAASPQAPEDTPVAAADAAPAAAPGTTRITLDSIVTPAQALLSGKVDFKSGAYARWYIDQSGRLSLDPTSLSAQDPSEEDIQEFQVELHRLIKQSQAAGGF